MTRGKRSGGAQSGFPPARNAPATRVVKNVRTNRRPFTNKGFFSFLLRFNYKIKDTEGGDSDRRQIAMLPEGESVLVHICCAPDASYGIPAMSKRFRVSGFFFNPNIWPGQEHDRRLQATRQLQDALPFALTVVGGGGEGEKPGVFFLEADMKKNDGFLKSVETAKRFGIYRQNYCGCRYSLTGRGGPPGRGGGGRHQTHKYKK